MTLASSTAQRLVVVIVEYVLAYCTDVFDGNAANQSNPMSRSCRKVVAVQKLNEYGGWQTDFTPVELSSFEFWIAHSGALHAWLPCLSMTRDAVYVLRDSTVSRLGSSAKLETPHSMSHRPL